MIGNCHSRFRCQQCYQYLQTIYRIDYDVNLGYKVLRTTLKLLEIALTIVSWENNYYIS